MARYLIAVVLGCLYVAGSIWVVDRAGRDYRDRLSKPKPAAKIIEEPSAPAPTERHKTKVVVDAAEPGPSRPKPAAADPAPADSADSSAKPPAEPARPTQPPIEPARPKPATAPSTDPAPSRPTPAATPTANPLANDPFWNQPQLTQPWDVTHLKPEDEVRLGAEMHNLIVKFNPPVNDDTCLSRVEDAAEPFLKELLRKEIKYRFFILNSDVVNAFSTPGGYVYVSRGLFDLIGEDEDEALQFAIGHEIAHVDLQHAIKCLQDPGVKSLSGGTLQKLYWLIIPFGYLSSNSVDQEFEADEWVWRRMQRFPRTRRETLIFLEKLKDYAKNHGFGSGRIQPQQNRDIISPLDNHYRAKTAARHRLNNLKQRMDEAAKTTK